MMKVFCVKSGLKGGTGAGAAGFLCVMFLFRAVALGGTTIVTVMIQQR